MYNVDGLSLFQATNTSFVFVTAGYGARPAPSTVPFPHGKEPSVLTLVTTEDNTPATSY